MADNARRFKDVDTQLADLLASTDGNRDAIAAEALKRETECRNLEQKAIELQGLLSVESKERQTMDADLRKYLDAEILARDESVAAERRAREAGDLQIADAWKSAVRDERETREGELADVAKDLLGIKTRLAEDIGKREDERSQQHLAMEKLRSDIAELEAERKVAAVAMREAFGQVSEELKSAQRARKEDIDRLDASIAALSGRVDTNARQARDKTFALEQMLQGLQSELQRESDDRTAAVTKLEAHVNEEHRFTEAAVAAETKAREENATLLEEGFRLGIGEEARKTKVSVDKIVGQIMTLSEDVEKDRAIHADTRREVAKALAAIQGSVSGEEQARQQLAASVNRSIELVREEVSTETKERRAQGQALAEDVTLLQRGLQQRDDRADSLANQLNQECNDLRERTVKETRLREAAIAQLEQSLLNQQAAKDGTPGSMQALMGSVGTSESAERWRQADEDMERMKRAVTALQSENQALGKSVANIEDGLDAFKTRLGATANDIADVHKRLKTFVDLEASAIAAAEERRKETAERKADAERLTVMISEGEERLERAEQLRIKSEGEMRQEVQDVKNNLKKEARERELLANKLVGTVREEAQKREEAVERESRIRQEGLERQAEAFHAGLREERKASEREDLRIEGRSLGVVGAKAPGDPSSAEAAGLVMEQRALRQGLSELQDRLASAEVRQRNAEERTVSMLDAIMGGLAGSQD